jgi:hypothetical protein
MVEALERGRFDAAFLSRFERDFRRHFDPSMRYLDLCAAVLRNRHLREFWLNAGTRGFAEATADPVFARVAGSLFGGPELRPLPILGHLWSKIVGYLAEGSARMLLDGSGGWIADLGAWRRGWWRSLVDDPHWHVSWMADVAKKSARLQRTLWTSGNPRVRGLLPIVEKTSSPFPRTLECMSP